MKTATCDVRKWLLKVEAAGIESESSSAANGMVETGYITCQECGAVNALHLGITTCRPMASNDEELQAVAAAWDALPAKLRAAIVAIATTQK